MPSLSAGADAWARANHLFRAQAQAHAQVQARARAHAHAHAQARGVPPAAQQGPVHHQHMVVAPCADPMDVSRAGVAIAIAPAGSSQDQDQNKLAARGPTPLCMQQPFASLPDAPAPQARPQAFQHIVPLAPATNTFLGKRVPPHSAPGDDRDAHDTERFLKRRCLWAQPPTAQAGSATDANGGHGVRNGQVGTSAWQ